MQTLRHCARRAFDIVLSVGTKKPLLQNLPHAGLKFTLFLGLVAGLPALSIDLSIPTLALLPDVLHTSVFVAGLSLSLFLLGFGVGQFVGGRGSDRFGRRPVLIMGLLLYVFAGICCSFATTGGELATARLVQGVGAGACSVQAFAMVQDLFTGDAARRKQAYVSVVLTLMPMIAPALGSLILVFCSWRMVHAALAIGGAILAIIVALFVAETRPERVGGAGSGLGLKASIGLLRDPAFRRIAAVNAFSYASIFAYIAGAPVVIIAQRGYGNLVFASIFAATALSLSAGAMTSARLANRRTTRGLVWPALLTQALTNAGLIVATIIPFPAGAWLSLPLLIVSCFARGIISPNLVHAAISSHREQAGLAAALVGLAQLGTAAISSGVLARLLGDFGALSVSFTMATLTAIAVLLWCSTGLGASLDKRAR